MSNETGMWNNIYVVHIPVFRLDMHEVFTSSIIFIMSWHKNWIARFDKNVIAFIEFNLTNGDKNTTHKWNWAYLHES